ncbi:MAG TPA: hypothetical protein VGQ03_09835 [Nitrososphaera sp.]|jgi:hypothetical protein|nr:hypothetical protein [Nitrososphaera sp.]
MPNLNTNGLAVLIVGIAVCGLLAAGTKVPASTLPPQDEVKRPLDDIGNTMLALAILFGVALVIGVIFAGGKMPTASLRW